MAGTPTDFVADFDVAALSEPLTADQVEDFRRSVLDRPDFPPLARATVEVVGTAIGYGAIALVIDAMVSGTLSGIAWAISGGIALVWWIGLAATMVVFGRVLWPWPRMRIRLGLLIRGSWLRRARMQRFAAANGLLYSPRIGQPPAFASVLATGHHRIVWDHFRGRTFDVGNYRTADDRNQAAAPLGWGFVSIRLDRDVPHMVLVPTGSRRAAQLTSISRVQTLKLEGDFDRHFTLFVPTGYERDALYVFTPDLMADLIDVVPGSFVELHGRTLTVAFPGYFDLGSDEGWSRVSRILASVGRRGHRQTARYLDERPSGDRRGPLRRIQLRPGLAVLAIGVALWGMSGLVRLLLATHG